MKFAMKVSYFGLGFEGSQKQPRKRTVQGELEKIIGPVKISSRTDTGVSSLASIFVFESNKKPNVNRINQLLPKDILALDLVQVPDNFNPRYAELKHYRYYLPYTGQNIQKLKKKKFNIPPKTTLEKLTIKKKSGFVVFDFQGPHFGYKAIRKIIGQILGIGIAPPWGLVLMDVKYPKIRFKNKVKETFRKRFDKELEKHLQLSRVLQDLRGA
jgi:tRNA pseudouridine38-40 synthase